MATTLYPSVSASYPVEGKLVRLFRKDGSDIFGKRQGEKFIVAGCYEVYLTEISRWEQI